MKTKTITETITQKEADIFLETLRLGKPHENHRSDQPIHQITAQFDDGVDITIDINNGGHDDNSAPYLNVNWSDDGDDLYALGAEPDELLGEYSMTYDKEDENGIEQETEYIVQLVVAKP